MVFLEILLEGLNVKCISTISTNIYDITLNSLKVFILKPSIQLPLKEPHQVLIISGPETCNAYVPKLLVKIFILVVIIKHLFF